MVEIIWNTGRPPAKPTSASIIEDVANEAGLTVREMLTRSRIRRYAWPRQEAMRRLHGAGYTTPQIGQMLKGKGPAYDHTTVLHGIKRAKERRAKC